MALHPELLETMSSAEFVGLIKSMSDQEIRDDFAGEHRGVLLDAIFARFPHQFRARQGRRPQRAHRLPGHRWTGRQQRHLRRASSTTAPARVEKGAGESPRPVAHARAGRVPQARSPAPATRR